MCWVCFTDDSPTRITSQCNNNKKLETFSEDLFRTTGKDLGTGINEKFSGIDLSFNAAERQVKTLLVEVPLAFFLERERA